MKLLYYGSAIFMGLIATASLTQAVCTQPIAQFPDNQSTISFEGVLHNFPSFGKSTWFYKIDNSGGTKGISHTSFQVSRCIDNSLFERGGTYTSQTSHGLHYSKYFVLGNDPSIPQQPYSIKYEQEVIEKTTTYLFYVLNENLQVGTNLIYIKPGSTFESDSICGPSLSCEPVPVTLMDFTVQKVNGHPFLNWSTASEKNNFGFFIEHCFDGHFHEEGFVESGHESDSVRKYSFTDLIHNWGYYRLRIEDFDGHAGYSPIVFLSIEDSYNQTLIYPTIAEGRVTLFNKEMIIHAVSLFNHSGASLVVQRESNEHGVNIITESLPSGLYFIRVNEIETFRFMKK
jgi:hypothetical protein